MADTASNVHPINKGAQPTTPNTETEPSKAPGKPKLTKILPTDRMTFDKQLHLLRGYAAAYTHFNTPVSGRQVAQVAKLNRNTISTANAFFVDVGLLEKSGGGFIPSGPTIAFNHAHEWNAETAPQKLAPLLQNSWFAKKLMPLVMMGQLSEEAAIRELAAESTAQPENRTQLRILLDFLEKSGILKREGDSYVRGNTTVRKTDADSQEPEQTAPAASTQQAATEPKEMPRDTLPRTTTTTTTFHQMTAGAVQFSINLKVDMAEFAGWEPDRITAFFAGIAQVLAAKAKVEQDIDV